MKRYVIDLDHTICVPGTEADTQQRYAEALPIYRMIQKIRDVKRGGGYVIIHTARRMVTHNGDLQAIMADVGKVTEDWLKKHGVPYDELVFGKPYGDVYIDDKAMTPSDFCKDISDV